MRNRIQYTRISAEPARSVDKSLKMDTIQDAQAEVAELADALGSGLSSRKGVRVQVPPSAYNITRRNAGFLF
jgi:hypothetical protein